MQNIGQKCPYPIQMVSITKWTQKSAVLIITNFNVFDDQRHSDGVCGMCGNNSVILWCHLASDSYLAISVHTGTWWTSLRPWNLIIIDKNIINKLHNC